ncbi:hypothetical protein Bca101_043953 [Brassica carinata]
MGVPPVGFACYSQLPVPEGVARLRRGVLSEVWLPAVRARRFACYMQLGLRSAPLLGFRLPDSHRPTCLVVLLTCLLLRVSHGGSSFSDESIKLFRVALASFLLHLSLPELRDLLSKPNRNHRSSTLVALGLTSVLMKGLAEHKDVYGSPLCPCRHFDDKAAEVGQGFWNCPCVPMRERSMDMIKQSLTEDHPAEKDGEYISTPAEQRFLGRARANAVKVLLSMRREQLWQQKSTKFYL